MITHLLLSAEGHDSTSLLLMALAVIAFWGVVLFVVIKFGLIILKHVVSFFLPYWID